MCGSVPGISVIIPVYRHAAWVGQAVESVLQQSFTDWELIIIDDASPDDSWDVLGSVVKPLADTRISLHRHAVNQGAASTLNEGLALAQGSYIAILNSDDAWHPHRLERLHQRATQDSLDFIATRPHLMDSHSLPKEASEPDWLHWYQGLATDYREQQDLLRTLLRGNFLITTSNFFMHRRVYERLGGFANLRYVHDYEYVLRLYAAGLNLHYLWDEPLLDYRLHDTNTIREKPLAAIEENMHMLLGQLPLLATQLNQARLQGLQIQLRDLYRYTREEWLSEIHFRLVDKEQELFALIAARDGWVQERDVWVQERDRWLAESEVLVAQQQQWLADRDGWIEERDAQIYALQQTTAAQQQMINDRNGWIEERDTVVAHQQHWLADRERWIAERDQVIAHQQHWLAERDQLIRRLQHENSRLLESRSYRLGRALLSPWRVLRELPDKWGVRHA